VVKDGALAIATVMTCTLSWTTAWSTARWRRSGCRPSRRSWKSR
jgi:hypothetical protein